MRVPTTIVNKAAEIRWWIDSKRHTAKPGLEEIMAHIKQRWPDLDEDLHARIARLSVDPAQQP